MTTYFTDANGNPDCYTPPWERSERKPDLCPGCGESVDHPLYPDCYADNVRLIGQPRTGWHNVCAEEAEAAERSAA